MSRKLDDELHRLMSVDNAVRAYFSVLAAVEQGAEEDDGTLDKLRDDLGRLTEDG